MKTECIIDNESVELIDHSLSGLEVALEQFFKDWEASKSRNETLSSQFRSLQETHEGLQKDFTDQHEAIHQQQEEINNLSELVKAMQNQRNEFLQETKLDLHARTQLLNAKYLSESLTTKVRQLERELSSQKVECERLKILYNKSKREPV